MKTLDDLKRIREEAAKKMNLRNRKNGYRVVVGMATCGIAAGARPVLNKLVELVQEKGLDNVAVTQVGCMGKCTLEPIVEVYSPEGKRYTYCHITEEKALRIIDEHVINGKVCEDMLISNFNG